MAQNFNSLKASSLIKNDRQTINDNFDAVRSCHSGTAYPTVELVAGMLFFNTSTKKLYEYNGSAWVQIFDLSSGTAVATKAGNADSATKATDDKNGKDITTYVAKLEQDANNEFVIRVYNGANTLMTTITIPETEVDVMTGASSSSAGKAGLVPPPSAGVKNRYLNAYGNFETIDVPVQSVNGKTGDVVVGEVTDLSISDTTITVTFADGTTKTLTTQDTNTHQTWTQKGTRTTTGTWSITGCTVGKPLIIVAEQTASSSYCNARLQSVSGCIGCKVIETDKIFALSADEDEHRSTSCSLTVIPTSTTVALNVVEILSMKLYAYN